MKHLPRASLFSALLFAGLGDGEEELWCLLAQECCCFGGIWRTPESIVSRVCSSHSQRSASLPKMSVDFNTAEAKNNSRTDTRSNKRTTVTIKKNRNPGWVKERSLNIKGPAVLSGPAAYNVCEECGTSSVWTLQLLYPTRLIEPGIIGM